MEWTKNLHVPQVSGDPDLFGYKAAAVQSCNERYDKWYEEYIGNLSRGRLVVVRNWSPNASTAWNAQSISALKGPLSQQVQYQGSLFIFVSIHCLIILVDTELRANTYHSDVDEIHGECTLGEFIERGINDPEHCGNCLDLPGLRAEYPPFILYVLFNLIVSAYLDTIYIDVSRTARGLLS